MLDFFPYGCILIISVDDNKKQEVKGMKKEIIKNKKMFFGFEYADGTSTTCGEPNKGFEKFNGRLSIAGGAVVFTSKKERDVWVSSGCSSYGGRIAVSRPELRRMCAGMESERYREYIESLEFYATNK